MPKVVIDPVTRIEGHLRVTCQVENGKVVDAWNTATMFRGFEIFMKGRHPEDAWQFAQRICGVCPTPHAHASTLASEHAMGYTKVPDNARIIRNMFEATHVGYDHILWFYILNAFDYVNVPDVLNAKAKTPALLAIQDQVKAVVASGQLGPFAGHWWDHPAYKLPPELNLELTAHYLQAIEAQAIANDAQAFIGGRFPMVMTYIPGGMQERLPLETILYYQDQMTKVKDFVDNVMLQDLLAIAPFYIDLAGQGQGVGNYLSWGLFDVESQIPEERILPRGMILNRNVGAVEKPSLDEVKIFTEHSFYNDSVGQGKHPLDAGQEPIEYVKQPTIDSPNLPTGKYDWTQAARYGASDLPLEVGPLAEILVAYGAGRPEVVDLVNSTLTAIGAAGKPEVLMSNLGRIAGRVLRAKLNTDFALQWSQELLANYGKGKVDTWAQINTNSDGEGAGGWNAPRGALAHYMRIKGGKIADYAAVPPSNWNLSPRDAKGVRGPLEQSLVGVPVVDPAKPLEILRTVHTFDP